MVNVINSDTYAETSGGSWAEPPPLPDLRPPVPPLEPPSPFAPAPPASSHQFRTWFERVEKGEASGGHEKTVNQEKQFLGTSI